MKITEQTALTRQLNSLNKDYQKPSHLTLTWGNQILDINEVEIDFSDVEVTPYTNDSVLMNVVTFTAKASSPFEFWK